MELKTLSIHFQTISNWALIAPVDCFAAVELELLKQSDIIAKRNILTVLIIDGNVAFRM